ncbi:fumarylacetoacetate hydrolase family protein [Herbiconiux sp.]|uniref:fumarylacetoacetate hydrolase family protein n=1 Tax=Herbiconiux sp. TaxID=1871186 RepID=UPI0025C019B3|nr:fumarylacetoacetate hydrolase family protein [Herbiconiux sp.]
MRWVRYISDSDGLEHVGMLGSDTILALGAEERLLDILGRGDLEQAARAATEAPFEVVPASSVHLLAPIETPPSVRDFMSFEEHVTASMAALGRSVSTVWYERPVFYFSNPVAVAGPAQAIAIPPGCAEFDFELEIAAVVGDRCSDVAVDDAERHIAGYTILCDWSARDLQEREMAVGLGPSKGKDSATTLGPALVTPDELTDRRSGHGYALRMSVDVNGRPYSRGDWSSIHWSFAQMLSHASRGTTLVPGDVLGSGTVGTGCILELGRVHGFERFPYLEAGDVVTLEVERLGRISTTIQPPRGA